MTSTNILVVEDELLIAMDIAERLQSMGYNVAGIADSAETALTLAAQARPDLVLMDIRLRDDMDGIAAAQLLRDQFRLPVVFLTSYTDKLTLERAKTAQPFGYITKPIQDKDLSTTIEIALARYQVERQTQQTLEQQTQLNELKSRFIAIVSHEFRNPLNSIKFSAELLNQQGSDLTEERRAAYFQRIRSAVEQMNQLLEEVLLLSEHEIGAVTLNCVPVDVVWFCRDLVEEMQFQISHHISLTFLPAVPEPQAIYYLLDTRMLRHILVNLLSNAVKYSPHGESIQFEAICEADQLTFRIIDQGIGIPEEEQELLFEPFYRASNVAFIAGTGLGLVIVKQCVEACGGEILLESCLNQGTTVTVRLPISQEVLVPAQPLGS
ncbi:hybrid sensor histidine kinase/response regulator [Leptolyngbya sp. AN02str]|uniref:hybrid sensor histidine kinase/response regulator n=1 Tax=Leptolyngbya sp. AN02str TaxID=3423363 RepID=UPI003D31A957